MSLFSRSHTDELILHAFRLLQAEQLKKESDEKNYINPEISQQEKEKGNDCFRNAQYPDAIKHYTEAIRRNPTVWPSFFPRHR
jgi:hypothetical protein